MKSRQQTVESESQESQSSATQTIDATETGADTSIQETKSEILTKQEANKGAVVPELGAPSDPVSSCPDEDKSIATTSPVTEVVSQGTLNGKQKSPIISKSKSSMAKADDEHLSAQPDSGKENGNEIHATADNESGQDISYPLLSQQPDTNSSNKIETVNITSNQLNINGDSQDSNDLSKKEFSSDLGIETNGPSTPTIDSQESNGQQEGPKQEPQQQTSIRKSDSFSQQYQHHHKNTQPSYHLNHQTHNSHQFQQHQQHNVSSRSSSSSNHNSQQHQQRQQHHNINKNEQLSKTNLYIRGLNADTSDNDLFTLCSRFGKIVSTKAILDKNTNKCKGYGFVDFESPEAAEMAVICLQKQGILVHMAKQQEADPTNLYIANLPILMTESELENLLKPYGQVVSTRILINQNRQPRGVGFARMETKEQCDAIINSLNGQTIKASRDPLLIKFADGASRKKNNHFQHKPMGGNPFIGDHMWRNNGGNDPNYHMMNNALVGNRNFHGPPFDHSRHNPGMHHHNNGAPGVTKHQMISSVQGYHPHLQGAGHHSHSNPHHNHQQHHQSQLQQQHHAPNQSSHSSHRNHNQVSYSGASNFPMSGSISGSNDASQWLHPSQAGQP